jgi:hypothetical protein
LLSAGLPTLEFLQFALSLGNGGEIKR